jgi:hypothetical protein
MHTVKCRSERRQRMDMDTGWKWTSSSSSRLYSTALQRLRKCYTLCCEEQRWMKDRDPSMCCIFCWENALVQIQFASNISSHLIASLIVETFFRSTPSTVVKTASLPLPQPPAKDLVIMLPSSLSTLPPAGRLLRSARE